MIVVVVLTNEATGFFRIFIDRSKPIPPSHSVQQYNNHRCSFGGKHIYIYYIFVRAFTPCEQTRTRDCVYRGIVLPIAIMARPCSRVVPRYIIYCITSSP